MGRSLDEVISKLPPDRQARIASLAKDKVDDMLAHAATLTDFRKAVGKTQAEVAKELGIKQNAVSQLEKRYDTYVSTLRRFLQSLGLTLELSVVSKSGTRISLPNFHPWDEVDSTMPVPTSSAAKASNKVRRASASSALKKDDQLKSHRATNPVTTEEKTAKARKQRATPGHQ